MDGNTALKAEKWAVSGETGTSSEAMLAVMLGEKPKTGFCYPSDGGDLGRCLGLLEAVPEFRSRLHEMKAVSPEWAALIEHWGELEAMHAKKDPKLYDRMKAILDPIERKNPNLIRFGNGGALYFGK